MKVAAASPSFSRNSILVQELTSQFPEARINSECLELSHEELILFLKDSQAAIIGREAITAQIMDCLPQLDCLVKYGVGLDNIDLEYAQKKGISVMCSEGTNRRSVAELTLCFLLGLARNVFFSYAEMKTGKWFKNGGWQLSAKKIGIIGCGHIGSELTQLLQNFQCEIWINDIIEKNNFVQKQKKLGQNIKLATKDEIYTHCDFISLHVPLTQSTHLLIDQKALEKMKSTAYLINTSRGMLIDESALKQALQKEIIAGAALDVFAEEPLADEELRRLPNLAYTPHIGGNSEEAVLAMGRSAIKQLNEYFLRF